MKKILLSALLFSILFGTYSAYAQNSLPNTGAYYSSSLKIDVTLPEYVGKLAGTYIDDIEYWKQGVGEIDRYRDEYLVIPLNGLVIPIVNIRDDLYDYTLLSQHETIDINKYLKTGALSYPGTSNNDYGEIGNKVIFGHSSYFTNDNGRYKTHFQKIIGLSLGTEIWIYKKDEKGIFHRYKYKTNLSYATKPTDLKILDSGTKKELTLFTCIPIGRVSDRWVVKAHFMEDFLYMDSSEIQKPILLKYKIAIRKFIFQVAQKKPQEKEIYIVNIFQKLDTLKKKTTNQKLKDLIIYFQQELTEEYYR